MERWLPVVGFEDRYLVSDLGRIRSLITGRFLRPGKSSNGYLSVALAGSSYLVQHLVAAAFIGPRPVGACVLHNDGCRANNVVSNLRYGTFSDNRKDAERHGTVPRGEKYANAKLTDAAVREIRRLRGKVSQSALAKQFGVSPAAVQAVHDGRTWTHVE